MVFLHKIFNKCSFSGTLVGTSITLKYHLCSSMSCAQADKTDCLISHSSLVYNTDNPL